MDEITQMISQFSDEYLNEEYKNLNIKLADKLSKTPDISLKRGKAENWACAIILAVGQLNFLFDRPTSPYITQDFLCSYFGCKRTSVTVKARDIRRRLNLKLGDEDFSTEFVLSLRIPESDEDLNRIRQLDQVKFLISQKRPEDVNDVDNTALTRLIRNSGEEYDMDELCYILRSSYLIYIHSGMSMLVSRDDENLIFPLFTSVDESKAVMESFDEGEPGIWLFMNIIDYLKLENFKGVIINPASDNFFIPAEIIEEVFPNDDEIDYWTIFYPRRS